MRTLIFLVAWFFCEVASAQTLRIVLFDSEYMTAQGVSQLSKVYDEMSLEMDPTRDRVFFLAEFDDRGWFDDVLIFRSGSDVKSLLSSDSVSAVSNGIAPDGSVWFRRISQSVDALPGVGGWAHSVTLFTSAPTDEFESRLEFLSKLATILGRTERSGAVKVSDSWRAYHLESKKTYAL